MVTTVAGPPLTKFTGHAQPQQALLGPGSNAYQMIPEDDVTTWLVSPGVVDCAILTIVVGTTRAGGEVIGGHRPGGGEAMARGVVRAMAHFNPFSGPRAPAITALFNSCLAGLTATVNNLTVAISFNAGAHRPYTNQLVTVVGAGRPCTALPHDVWLRRRIAGGPGHKNGHDLPVTRGQAQRVTAITGLRTASLPAGDARLCHAPAFAMRSDFRSNPRVTLRPWVARCG